MGSRRFYKVDCSTFDVEKPESGPGATIHLDDAFAILTQCVNEGVVFSERELTFTFAICYRPSVCRLSVCLSSVCL